MSMQPQQERSRERQHGALGQLVIVSESRTCALCGRYLMRGYEARRLVADSLAHVACFETLAGPAGA
jgi:hypothetical protein